MILDDLHSLLKIDYDGLKNVGRDLDGLPVLLEAIEKLHEVYKNIPEDYISIITQIDGVGLQYKEGDKIKFSPYILSALEAADYPVAWYPFLFVNLPDCFFFAQEDDDSYFLGEYGGRYGVYRVETSVADWESATYFAPSIRALLCNGVGWAPST